MDESTSESEVFHSVEQDALMSPNLCGKIEDSVDVCVCCLVVFNLLIHSLK